MQFLKQQQKQQNNCLLVQNVSEQVSQSENTFTSSPSLPAAGRKGWAGQMSTGKHLSQHLAELRGKDVGGSIFLKGASGLKSPENNSHDCVIT